VGAQPATTIGCDAVISWVAHPRGGTPWERVVCHNISGRMGILKTGTQWKPR